jgi:ABC-2 type transport system ATP-binding protein
VFHVERQIASGRPPAACTCARLAVAWPEVAQTVDQVLIINRGRLVVESSLEQLTSRVGGSVRIRRPEPDKLIAALKRAGIETTPSNDNTLLAHGTTSEQVGDLAFAAQVPLHELIADSSSLEDVFLELTSEQQA